MSSVISERIYKTNIPEQEFLNELNEYFKSGSKQLRSCLIFLFAKAINAEVNEKTVKLAAAVEIIHNATLIHDDIIDESDIRRGKTALHKKYGNKLSIIAGDYLLSLAINLLSETGNSKIIENFANCLNALCLGEIEQYFSQKTTPSLEEYIIKSEAKTASLFKASLKSLADLQEKKHSKSLETFAKYFGIAFQISDDLKNISALPQKEKQKPRFNDIKAGIYTAPVIYAFGENKLLDKFSTDEIIKKSGTKPIQEKTKQLIKTQVNEAKRQITNIPDSAYKQAILKLCDLI